MKVPYFDIRSHLLLWMILSSLFNVYQRQSTLRHSQSAVSAMLITEPRRTGGKYALITRCFLFRFSKCFKKKQWLRESAPRAMEIQVYWHIFRRKQGRFQMQVSEHKMYLIFCLYRLERL